MLPVSKSNLLTNWISSFSGLIRIVPEIFNAYSCFLILLSSISTVSEFESMRGSK